MQKQIARTPQLSLWHHRVSQGAWILVYTTNIWVLLIFFLWLRAVTIKHRFTLLEIQFFSSDWSDTSFLICGRVASKKISTPNAKEQLTNMFTKAIRDQLSSIMGGVFREESSLHILLQMNFHGSWYEDHRSEGVLSGATLEEHYNIDLCLL